MVIVTPMAVNLPHEQRCSCDHLAFLHEARAPHGCTEACGCTAFSELADADLLEW